MAVSNALTVCVQYADALPVADSVRRAKIASSIMYSGRPLRNYAADAIIDAFQGPRHIKAVRKDCIGHSFISLCVKYGVVFSKSGSSSLYHSTSADHEATHSTSEDYTGRQRNVSQWRDDKEK